MKILLKVKKFKNYNYNIKKLYIINIIYNMDYYKKYLKYKQKYLSLKGGNNVIYKDYVGIDFEFTKKFIKHDKNYRIEEKDLMRNENGSIAENTRFYYITNSNNHTIVLQETNDYIPTEIGIVNYASNVYVDYLNNKLPLTETGLIHVHDARFSYLNREFTHNDYDNYIICNIFPKLPNISIRIDVYNNMCENYKQIILNNDSYNTITNRKSTNYYTKDNNTEDYNKYKLDIIKQILCYDLLKHFEKTDDLIRNFLYKRETDSYTIISTIKNKIKNKIICVKGQTDIRLLEKMLNLQIGNAIIDINNYQYSKYYDGNLLKLKEIYEKIIIDYKENICNDIVLSNLVKIINEGKEHDPVIDAAMTIFIVFIYKQNNIP